MINLQVRDFLKTEAASGIILITCALFAIVLANSPAWYVYDSFLNLPVVLQVGRLEIAKPLLLWINDGMMAVFFMLIGLEVKREIMVGELSRPERVVLPAIAAVGGMIVPALVYYAFNVGDDVALRGWAIPVATDIAFALGVLSLLKDRVPHGLKVFLLTLAIIDDLGAIVIIALFYSQELSTQSIIVALCALAILIGFNVKGVSKISAYVLVGLILWIAVLKSGVHATLAGVALAFCIPLKTKDPNNPSPLESMEHDLHAPVAFIVLPMFAFANSGVDLSGISLATLANPITIGIAFGLLMGKFIGVFGFSWLAVTLKVASLPHYVTWRHMVGLALLCGVGFTMSLFISSLAFEGYSSEIGSSDRVGILLGSTLSAVLGYAVLRVFTSPSEQKSDIADESVSLKD